MESNFSVPGTLLEKEKEHDQVINNLNQNIEQTHSQINGKPKVMVVKVLSKNLYILMKNPTNPSTRLKTTTFWL
ncbi:hypothetical protein EL84_14235 [Paenibacillus sp. VT-400]|uniref:hypothetical protein n=1 Tax=Paenibacillus sp. VT-400 TaxID=1495853 RepID=UPI000649BBE2|nr:hypothetical protein [Paenibacillus sp. VT-400]KLU53444.1 hypothetical protein EL84_14235 [Paenibacillus sp. VT-400]